MQQKNVSSLAMYQDNRMREVNFTVGSALLIGESNIK